MRRCFFARVGYICVSSVEHNEERQNFYRNVLKAYSSLQAHRKNLRLKENIYNQLYDKAKNGETFTNLMPLVLSRENFGLAYRNIKNNAGIKTIGTDKLVITDIDKLTAEYVVAKVRYIVSETKICFRLQSCHLNYNIEFDLKELFNNENHVKLK